MITIIFGPPRIGKTAFMVHLLRQRVFDRSRNRAMQMTLAEKNRNGFNLTIPQHCVASNFEIKFTKTGYTPRKSRIIDPKKIGVMGSSAGGHLVASLSTVLDFFPEALTTPDETDALDYIPDFQILCYPVITMNEYTHKGSAQRVSGHDVLTEEDMATFSLERRVDSTTPPTFIWHTFTDKTVPVQNSIFFISALANAGVPFEAHIFPEGVHGLALCNEQTSEGKDNLLIPHAECWAELAVKWIKDF